MSTKPSSSETAQLPPSIRMGELRIGNGEQPLKTLLGSCIGLALYHRRTVIGGLAHIVLPNSQGRSGPPGKYVDTAIPALIRDIEVAGGITQGLNAKVAGGANMLASQAALTIGDQNLDTIRRMLGELSIPIVAEHCGGTQGRRMTFYPNTGRVTIDIVGGASTDI